MLQKQPKSSAKGFFKKSVVAIVAFETATFAASYYFYHRLNTDTDFRLYFHNNYPWALDKFYKLGEYMSAENNTRQLDLAVWTQEQKIK